jgi:hypothetical protein
MKFRSVKNEKVLSPGPGNYDPKIDIRQLYKGISIGTGNRSEITGSPSKENQPGPGEYNTRGSSTAQNQSYSIGRSKRRDNKNHNPGPGQYKVPYYVSDVPSYVMPNRPEEFKFV